MKLLFSLCIFLIVSSQAHALDTPDAQLQSMIKALKSVAKNNEPSYKSVDPYIDFDTLTLRSIKPHIDKFSDKQIKQFTKTFGTLIRAIAYPQSSTFYKDAKANYESAEINGKTALIHSQTTIEKEDFEMDVGYEMTKSTAWRLTDLYIDEDSLVKDYQNQFGRIISKDGVDGLIQKVKEKLAEVEAEK